MISFRTVLASHDADISASVIKDQKSCLPYLNCLGITNAKVPLKFQHSQLLGEKFNII